MSNNINLDPDRHLKFLKFIDRIKSLEIVGINLPSYWRKEEVKILAETLRDHKNATNIVVICRDLESANILRSIAKDSIKLIEETTKNANEMKNLPNTLLVIPKPTNLLTY